MILVVDDDDQVLDVLKRAIDKAGYRVEIASDGLEAFTHLRAPDCKCMLLDINMPRVNGIELLILMQAEGIEIPVILMAGAGDFEESEMMQFANVIKFFQKPFKIKEVLDAIEAIKHKPKD